LDVIARSKRLDTFHDALEEARRFLRLPGTEARARQRSPTPAGSPQALAPVRIRPDCPRHDCRDVPLPARHHR
jgi:hypothetical protein